MVLPPAVRASRDTFHGDPKFSSYAPRYRRTPRGTTTYVAERVTLCVGSLGILCPTVLEFIARLFPTFEHDAKRRVQRCFALAASLLSPRVQQLRPHVDREARQQGPLEDVGPTQSVATQGTLEFEPERRDTQHETHGERHVKVRGFAAAQARSGRRHRGIRGFVRHGFSIPTDVFNIRYAELKTGPPLHLTQPMNDNLPSEGDISDDERRRAFHDELRQIPESGGGRVIGRIPKKFAQWAIVAFVVLGLGGELVEHYYGNVGLPASTAPTTTFVTPSTIPAVATTTIPSVVTADDAFIGLKPIGTATVPMFSLTDQHGATITPATTRGKVTLITFFNKNCNDICPVEGAEIRDALGDLGPKSSQVAVDIINTDPFSYGTSTDPLALTETDLAAEPNVHFLTGPLANLNALWKATGIEIKVGATANEVSHNSLMYFVNPSLQLSAFATPFAKESTAGVFSLSSADERQFGQGIELEAVSLMQ